MSDNPLTSPMIAALPIGAGELSDTMLAALPCLQGPPEETLALRRWTGFLAP